MSFKLVLRKTKFNQLRRSAKRYMQMSDGTSFASALLKVKPVYYKGDDPKSKIKQISNMLDSVSVDLAPSDYFAYSIDADSIFCAHDYIIHSFPLDYSYVIDRSLKDIQQELSSLPVESSSVFSGVIDAYRKQILKMDAAVSRSDRDPSFKTWFSDFCKRQENFPAVDARDALQRVLLWNQLMWQTGHIHNGLGRLDKILENYDVDCSSFDILADFARTLHCFYRYKSSVLVGDTGQIIILGGLETDGSYFHNDWTKLFLDVSLKLSLPDPKVLLRTSFTMPDDLIERIVNYFEQGCANIILSNDDVVMPALESFGYSRNDSSNYGVSACWEPLLIGDSLEQNNLESINFALPLVHVISKCDLDELGGFNDFLELYYEKLDAQIYNIINLLDSIQWESDPIVSLFMEQCRYSGKDVSEGGARLNNYGITSVGLSSAIDSLLNIKKYVFETGAIKFEVLKESLLSDFEKFGEVREALFSNNEYFGSDSTAAVALTSEIMDHCQNLLSKYENKFGGKVKFGLSGPDYIIAGNATAATPDGRRSGEPFGTHISSRHKCAPTELIRFASMLDYSDCRANGNVVDILIQPWLAKSRESCHALVEGIVASKFFQMQFNTFNYEQLIDAKAHPELYKDLVVRVWGFSAYFNDLPEEYKDMLIERAKVSEAA